MIFHLTLVQGEQTEDEMYPLRLPDAKDIKDPTLMARERATQLSE
jgi:hypothetical protein